MRHNIQRLPSSRQRRVAVEQERSQDAARRRIKGMKESPLVRSMRGQIELAGLPEPVTEHYFAKPRRWRFDLAWIDRKLALEVEGGQWSSGRHQRPKGFEGDCEKYSEAAILGWTVLRATTDMVKDGRALEMLRRALHRDAD
jgi:hypothetical protein